MSFHRTVLCFYVYLCREIYECWRTKVTPYFHEHCLSGSKNHYKRRQCVFVYMKPNRSNHSVYRLFVRVCIVMGSGQNIKNLELTGERSMRFKRVQMVNNVLIFIKTCAAYERTVECNKTHETSCVH